MTRITLFVLATLGALSSGRPWAAASPVELASSERVAMRDLDAQLTRAAPPVEPGASGWPRSVDAAWGAMEDAIVEEHNRARQDPAAYAAHLEDLRRLFRGNLIHFQGEPSVITREGVAAVDEAIDYLRSVSPVPALIASKGMSRAADDHVRDQGPAGVTGHDGSDGSKPWDRLSRYGAWDVVVGENLSYGPDQARRVVMGLIIDDGVSDRGHRHNIFNQEFRYVGVACGPHRIFRTMCAIDYTAHFREE